jgi:hypothetical protein
MHYPKCDNSLIRLSQSQLNLLETCPPQFKKIYIDHLSSPMSLESQKSLHWGNQFHQLMQQHFLGLSIDSALVQYSNLNEMVKILFRSIIDKHTLSSEFWTEAEHYIAFKKDNYLLTAIYDLLIVRNNQVQILDWKTYLKPKDKKQLENDWQTRLYLYLLAETSTYLPENISMTYWFIKDKHKPQYLNFQYNQIQHNQTNLDLEKLLSYLNYNLYDINQDEDSFVHHKSCEDKCPYHYDLCLNKIS